MARITKPNPREHIVIVDTNILWHEDKGNVVHPDFEAFWADNASRFPMRLILPDVVRGELLFQQTSSALKLLEKANHQIEDISRVTGKKYSHRVTQDRVKKEVSERFDAWLHSKNAEIKRVPVADIDWNRVISDSIWRVLPFTPDPKYPKNEKGFRDCMILETLCAICKFYSEEVNIAFICADFALRRAAQARLDQNESFSAYESLADFTSFIELTRKNLTERFVKSILSRATAKFFDQKDPKCLLYNDDFYRRLRNQFKSDIENPKSGAIYELISPLQPRWKHIGREQAWVAAPQFKKLEDKSIYHWTSKITFVRLYQREPAGLGELIVVGERKLMVLSVDVHWKAQVHTDGRFFSCEIVCHERKEYSFEAPTDQQLERYGIQEEVEQKAAANQTAPSPPPAD